MLEASHLQLLLEGAQDSAEAWAFHGSCVADRAATVGTVLGVQLWQCWRAIHGLQHT